MTLVRLVLCQVLCTATRLYNLAKHFRKVIQQRNLKTAHLPHYGFHLGFHDEAHRLLLLDQLTLKYTKAHQLLRCGE